MPAGALGLNRLKFWTSPATQVLGRFRQLFGGAFVSVARFLLVGREKLRQLTRGHQKTVPGAPGGGVGAIVKVIFKVAKHALVAMLPTIVDRVWESLSEGLQKKLKSLIPDSIAEEYERRKATFEKALPFLEALANVDVLQWLKEIVAPFEEQLAKIGKAIAVLKDIKDVFNTIKWVLRTISCAKAVTGDLVSCGLSFFTSVADWVVEKAVANCRVQSTLIRHFLKLDLITTTAPNWVADQIIATARGFLPGDYHEVFADVPKHSYMVSASDVPCEEHRTPMEMLVDELSLVLGNDEAKLYALAELLDALGATDVVLDSKKTKQLLEMAGLIQVLGVTAQQMQEWARNVGETPKDMPDALRQSLSDLVRSIAGGDKAPTQFDVTGDTGGADQGAGGGGTGGGVGTGAGAGSDGGVALPGDKPVTTVPGSTVKFEGPSPGTVPDASVEIVAVNPPNAKRGQLVTLSLYGVRQSAGIDVVVSGVSARVVDGPKKVGQDKVMTYEILDTVTFDLQRAAAARQRGEALSCYRLCIVKGKKRTKKL
jgi:hypothetical protein